MSIPGIILRTTLLIVFALAVFTVVAFAVGLAAHIVGRTFGFGPEFSKVACYILLAAVIFLPKGWLRIPHPYTMRGSVVIAAPIDKVWDAIMPRARTDYYSQSISEIRDYKDDPTRFDFVFAKSLKEPGASCQLILRSRVVALVPGEYVMLSHENAHEFPGFAKEVVTAERAVRAMVEGTEVTFSETVSALTPLFLLTLFFVNPIDDTLKSLKAQLEGKTDTSWAARVTSDIELGRNPKDVTVAGVTACVVLSAIALALVWVVVQLAPSA